MDWSSKAHYEVSRQQFSRLAARIVIPKTSYYVASLMRAASEESLENQSKFVNRFYTVGWIASATLVAVGSALQNIVSAHLNLVGRLAQIKLGSALIEFSLGMLHAIQNIFFIALSPLFILFAIIYPKRTIGPLFTGQAWEKGALHTHPEYIKQPAKVLDAAWESEIKTKKGFTDSIEKLVKQKTLLRKEIPVADSVDEIEKPAPEDGKTDPLINDDKKRKLEELQSQLSDIEQKPDKRFQLHFEIDQKPQVVMLSMSNRGHLRLLQEVISQAASTDKLSSLESVKIESDFKEQETFLTEVNSQYNPLTPQVNRTHEGKYVIAIQVMLSTILNQGTDSSFSSEDLQRCFDPSGTWPILLGTLDDAIRDHSDHFTPDHPKRVLLQSLKEALDTFAMGLQHDPRSGYQKGIVRLTKTIDAFLECEKIGKALTFYQTNSDAKDLDATQQALFDEGKALDTLTDEQKRRLTQDDSLGSITIQEILESLCMARFTSVSLHDYKRQQIEGVYGPLPGQEEALTLNNFYDQFRGVNQSLFSRSPVLAKSSLGYAKQHLAGNIGIHFYPIAGHSIPHVHGTIERKDGKKTDILQHSTPTIQKGPIDLLTKTVKISPDYEFWIRTCQKQNKNILSVIHESCDGIEGIRQNARMNLSKRYDNFYSLTLPLDGPLFNGYKQNMTWSDFKTKLTLACSAPSKGNKTPMGIVISDNVRKLLPEGEITRILNETKKLFFAGQKNITSERQYHALLALFYTHLTEQLEDKLHFDFLHAGCKDDTDRGGTIKAINAIYHLLASNASEEEINTALSDLLVEFAGQGWLGKKQGVLFKRAILVEKVLELIKGKHPAITAQFAKLKAKDAYKIIKYHHETTDQAPFSSVALPGMRQGHSPAQTTRLFKDQLRLALDPSSWIHETDMSFESLYQSDIERLKHAFIQKLQNIKETSTVFYCNDCEVPQAAISNALSSLDTDQDEAISQFLTLFFEGREKGGEFTKKEIQFMMVNAHVISDEYIKVLNPLYQSVDHQADLSCSLPQEKSAQESTSSPAHLSARYLNTNQQIHVDTKSTLLHVDILGTVAQLTDGQDKEINFPMHISYAGRKATIVIVPEVFGSQSSAESQSDASVMTSPGKSVRSNSSLENEEALLTRSMNTHDSGELITK